MMVSEKIRCRCEVRIPYGDCESKPACRGACYRIVCSTRRSPARDSANQKGNLRDSWAQGLGGKGPDKQTCTGCRRQRRHEDVSGAVRKVEPKLLEQNPETSKVADSMRTGVRRKGFLENGYRYNSEDFFPAVGKKRVNKKGEGFTCSHQ